MVGRPHGRFTVDGSDQVERRIEEVVQQVARSVEVDLRPGELEALVLLGGYGRGEGGVEVVGGVEVPHNNLDFLLVSRRGDPAELRARLDPRLQAVARERGIGVDLGTIAGAALRRAPCAVMWYDMRHGHKTVLGNEEFVPSLAHFEAVRIPPTDARDLLTNRGTLLVINDLLLSRGAPTPEERKLVTKHVIKAIIGYGDAWLFFAGEYHWSYVEKRERMRRRRDVDERFRALYEEAMAFRFRPAYDAFGARDLQGWTAAVKLQLSLVHRAVEERRLGRPLADWSGYLEPAFTHVLWEDPLSPRGTARKLKNLLRGRSPSTSMGPLARLGLAVSGDRGALPLVFPAVVYEDAGPRMRAGAAAVLGASSDDPSALRRGYLRRWAVVGDTNFGKVLSQHRLDLREPEPR